MGERNQTELMIPDRGLSSNKYSVEGGPVVIL